MKWVCSRIRQNSDACQLIARIRTNSATPKCLNSSRAGNSLVRTKERLMLCNIQHPICFRRLHFVIALFVTLGSIDALTAQESTPLLELASQRQLFVDSWLIDDLANVGLMLHSPIDEGPVVHFDRPWEGPFCGYCTVIKDGELFRLYYRGRPDKGADGDIGEVTCYAESRDGLTWTKPSVNQFVVKEQAENNVILANAVPSTHNFSPMLDTAPNVDSQHRFKALGGTMSSGLLAWTSADGIHWSKLQEEPVIPVSMVPFKYMFDSQNLAFWSEAENCYVCYFRVFEGGIRRIVRSTSTNFLQWTAPVLMQYETNGQPSPIEHLYTNQTHPYYRAPQIYVSVAARFMPGRQVLNDEQAKAINVDPSYFKDTSDAIFMTTRGTDTYQRTFLSAFIRPGIGAHNWVSRTNYPALNIVQTGDTEMSVYVNQDYAQPSAHLRRYSMRLDGFASIHAEFEGGHFNTKSLTFDGSRLSINFSTSAAGGVRFEIQDADGKPIPGFTMADSVMQIGNEIDRNVTWKSGSDISSLSGKTIRLLCSMKDADLFSLQFVR